MHKYSVYLLACLMLLIPCESRSDNAVVGSGNCDEAGFVSALDHVQSTGGGTITFNCGATPTTIPFSYFKEISAPVVIDGGGLIRFDGDETSALFQVFTTARLDLHRLTLRRGAFFALENFGELGLDQVTVEDCVHSSLQNYGTAEIRHSRFLRNTSPERGAAINNDTGQLTILDTEFDGNVVNAGDAPGTGGAIHSSNTGDGEVSIRSSRFYRNRAFDGGAVYLDTDTTGAQIHNSQFEDNQAGYGGAIESWGVATRVDHSRFQGNQARLGDGGAIWAVQGTLFVQFGQFTGNSATTTGGAVSVYGNVVNVYNSSFASNQSGSHGGALYSSGSMLTVNSTFHGNSAAGPASGGGAISHTAMSSAGFVFLSTLSGNSAAYGAAITGDGTNSQVSVFGSILAGNTGGNCAGSTDSMGYNLSDDSHCAYTNTGDANSITLVLEPYGDYGGPTLTQPPQAGSPAINRIPGGDCLLAMFPYDQRGASRPAGDACDSGAFEVNALIGIFTDRFED